MQGETTFEVFLGKGCSPTSGQLGRIGLPDGLAFVDLGIFHQAALEFELYSS